MLYIDGHFIHKEVQNKTIYELTHHVQTGVIDLNPPYQRGLVWSLDQKRELIDTILWGVSVPSLYLRLLNLGMKTPYEVLDGKQRLSALVDFVEDRFDYNGIKYSQVPEVERRRFEWETIGVTVVHKISDKGA